MDAFVVKVCGGVLSIWALLVGLMMTLASDARFTSVQWKFVLQMPGGQVTLGVIFLILGAIMALGLVIDRSRLGQLGSTALGGVTIIYATTLGAAALTETTGGVMGFPTFGLIGIFYLIYGNLIRNP